MSQAKPNKKTEVGVKSVFILAYGLTVGALLSGIMILLRFIRESPPPGTQDSGESSPPGDARVHPQTGIAEPTPEGKPYPITITAQSETNALGAGREMPDSPSRIEMTAVEAELFVPSAAGQWSQPTKYIVAVGLVLALLFIAFLGRIAIPMLIFAAIVAFIVQPVIRLFNQRFHMRPGPATLVTYLLVVVVLILLPLILIPALINGINLFLNIDFQAAAQSFARAVESAAASIGDIPVLDFLFGSGLDALSQALQGISALETPEPTSLQASIATLGDRLARTMGLLVNVLGPLISAIVALMFMLMISLHMSLSGQQLFDSLVELVPPAYKSEIMRLIDRIGNVWASFLRGQLTLMIFIGTMVWLGNLVLGTPQALFLGILSGLLEVIPSLGPLLALIPAVLVALIFGSTHFAIDPLLFAIIVALFYMLVQVVENQLVVPKILGEAVDLPPLVVLLGVFVGGALYGILGIFLATPVISSGREVFLYLYDKILEKAEVEEPPEEKPSFMDAIRGAAGRLRLPFQRDREEPSPE
jgi:predicted PurR-regulated permease PerM